MFSVCVFCLCFRSVFSLCVFCLCFLCVFSVCVFSVCFLSVFSLCVFSLCVFCLCFLSFTCHCPEGLRNHHQRPKPQIQRRGQEALASRNQSKAKEGQKVVQEKAVAQTSQQASSTKPWRRLRSNAFVGHTICQMVVAKLKQEKVAPRAFTYVPSRGVSNPTRFKTIVEAIQVSPMAGLYQDSRSAKFLH